jgi:hypothetical protein
LIKEFDFKFGWDISVDTINTLPLMMLHMISLESDTGRETSDKVCEESSISVVDLSLPT